MNLKTSKTQAIEIVSLDEHDDLVLCGLCGLEEVTDSLYFAIKNKLYSDSNLFKNVFGFDCLFFYILEQIKNKKVVSFERGIGYLQQKNDAIVLKRKYPISRSSPNGTPVACENGTCSKFNCSDCDKIVAYSSFPLIYAEALVDDNSLITSIGPFMPHSFVVENNSLVARLDDNLQSLSFDDSNFINIIVNCVKNFTKQLVLKTSRLDVKRIAADILQLNTSKNPVAKRGSLVYDEDGKLKLYDGEKWKIISFEE